MKATLNIILVGCFALACCWLLTRPAEPIGENSPQANPFDQFDKEPTKEFDPDAFLAEPVETDYSKRLSPLDEEPIVVFGGGSTPSESQEEIDRQNEWIQRENNRVLLEYAVDDLKEEVKRQTEAITTAQKHNQKALDDLYEDLSYKIEANN